ncbi:MAG: hypothetical protein R3E67_08680 [Pseudomonadales bacterium]
MLLSMVSDCVVIQGAPADSLLPTSMDGRTHLVDGQQWQQRQILQNKGVSRLSYYISDNGQDVTAMQVPVNLEGFNWFVASKSIVKRRMSRFNIFSG